MTDETRKPWKRKRNSANERGYGWAWRKVREKALKRDDYLCVRCRDEGRITPARQVDHILPKANGGGDELGNLMSLCKDCHDDKTAADNGWRKRIRIGDDGWPL